MYFYSVTDYSYEQIVDNIELAPDVTSPVLSSNLTLEFMLILDIFLLLNTGFESSFSVWIKEK